MRPKFCIRTAFATKDPDLVLHHRTRQRALLPLHSLAPRLSESLVATMNTRVRNISSVGRWRAKRSTSESRSESSASDTELNDGVPTAKRSLSAARSWA